LSSSKSIKEEDYQAQLVDHWIISGVDSIVGKSNPKAAGIPDFAVAFIILFFMVILGRQMLLTGYSWFSSSWVAPYSDLAESRYDLAPLREDM